MDGGWIVFTAVYRVVQPALRFVMTRIKICILNLMLSPSGRSHDHNLIRNFILSWTLDIRLANGLKHFSSFSDHLPTSCYTDA